MNLTPNSHSTFLDSSDLSRNPDIRDGREERERKSGSGGVTSPCPEQRGRSYSECRYSYIQTAVIPVDSDVRERSRFTHREIRSVVGVRRGFTVRFVSHRGLKTLLPSISFMSLESEAKSALRLLLTRECRTYFGERERFPYS